MTSSIFQTTELGFQTLQASVAARVDLDVRLPRWPFREARGYALIFEYDRLLGGRFGNVLAELAETYGDDEVTAVGIDPRPAYYRDEYGLFPAFQVKGDRVRGEYGAALRFEPAGDPTGSLGDSLNAIAVAGSSGAWAVFGQRDWEIGLLLAPDSHGGWLAAGVPWFGADVDLDSIRSPAGWGANLSDADREEFARRIREYGSGPRSGL
ncbi:hypothetical protein SAMN05421595_0701 [Austwickia chelonae]|uniref:Uncharacterized protein n=1 Tax=Austwickia chelonae NBRC 105200 TaxID=1184607 RepID=K6VS65_9MICO|nr:hypothetical protein [Austwickia chelonae]GAB78180.1 hypothetical protein AUCHE_08_04250 [Austwickia chelonae NBRC 105200]SEV98307.1 hypothetical protein SAMN05421595_0701 [Austwickia chelonae]